MNREKLLRATPSSKVTPVQKKLMRSNVNENTTITILNCLSPPTISASLSIVSIQYLLQKLNSTSDLHDLSHLLLPTFLNNIGTVCSSQHFQLMNPFNFQLRAYSDLPLITSDQFQQMQKSKRAVLWKDLVLDLTDFEHPGYNNIIDDFRGKNIAEAYSSRLHSLNADLVVCHLAVGRLQSSPLQSQSKSFYNSIRSHQIVKKHEEIASKIDFKEPLMEGINKLSQDQFNILTDIPKFFKEPGQVTYEKDPWKNFFTETFFWLSTPLFTLELTFLLLWLFNTYSLIEVVSSGYVAALGCLAWTLTEYYFHRFELHKESYPEGTYHAHLIHHAFPNLRNKIALSFWKNSIILFAMFIGLFYLIGELVALEFMSGFIAAMIVYDSIHYYCHFGPELEIKWLKTLRINHLKHHYRNSQTNFGVTTSLWDIVFGTVDHKQKEA